MNRTAVVLLALAATIGLIPSPISAQLHAPRPGVQADAGRSVDYFVSRHRLALEDGRRLDASGAGGRVMWSLAPLAEEARLPLLTQVAVGGYVVHTLGATARHDVWHYGMQTDVRLTGEPLAQRIDPIVSLGFGAVRAEEPVRILAVAGSAYPRMATHLSVAPGVGARLRLLPGLNLRSDLRSVIDLRDESRRHLELSGGLSVTL